MSPQKIYNFRIKVLSGLSITIFLNVVNKLVHIWYSARIIPVDYPVYSKFFLEKGDHKGALCWEEGYDKISSMDQQKGGKLKFWAQIPVLPFISCVT